MPMSALVKLALKVSGLPQEAEMAAERVGALASMAVTELLAGARFCQKRLWLMWPPPLNLMAACSAIWSGTDAVAYLCSAEFKFVTYAWWCLLWCSSIICAEMAGSSAWYRVTC